MMDLAGKRVLVVGLGRSGTAVAILCAAHGAKVTVTDKRAADVLGPALAELPRSIKVEIGGHQKETFVSSQLIVLSPGVPEIPELAAARAAGVTITGEIEVASRFIESQVIAITGTNGKSTTTTLAGAVTKASGRPTFVGGNLGDPLALAVGTPAGSPGGACVVELSSFQLETVETFHPRVAVLLNITPDHLDRYRDMDHYAETKARIFAAQRSSDYAVINLDDPLVVRHTANLKARKLGFSLERKLTEGAWLEGEELMVRLPGARTESYPTAVPALVGRHNQANALAALLSSRLLGASHAEALRALSEFQPLAHRMELVNKAGGVLYYDDSKGTNVGAVVAALDGFPRRVVLIAGGRDKGGDYAPLAAAMGRVGRAAVLIGEAADKIEAAFTGVVPTRRAATMEEAVETSAALAQAGDAVVLSPACSSFDMFRDYAHRAQVYREAVDRLAAREGTPVITLGGNGGP
jgi:UDP-N-acetylmuramoylalanine--D-glutamate ligase